MWMTEFTYSITWRLLAVVVLLFAISASIAAQAQQPNDPSSVVLPGHCYHLPPTLITAAQIESHKKT
jgi:hypothetical protein